MQREAFVIESRRAQVHMRAKYPVIASDPNEHKASFQCWFDAGPPHTPLYRHCISVWCLPGVCLIHKYYYCIAARLAAHQSGSGISFPVSDGPL